MGKFLTGHLVDEVIFTAEDDENAAELSGLCCLEMLIRDPMNDDYLLQSHNV